MGEMQSTRPRPGEPYVVPKRFGLRTLLFVTTAFGLVFAAAKSTPAPAVALIFYSSFLFFISVSQMAIPKLPRMASIVAGAMFMPAAVYGASYTPLGSEFILQILPRMSTQNEFLWMAWLVIIGGFLGYLGGTLLAGIFMLSDLLARFLQSFRGTGPKGNQEGPA